MASLAGSFLIARPVLQDPSFIRTVVLVLQHGADGAFGLVVNRPAPIEGLPFPVFVGGPCESSGYLMLHGHPEWVEAADDGDTDPLAPGVFMGDASCLGRINDLPAGKARRYRMFKGYAGWGPKQLERELAAGAWAVVPATGEILFETPPLELWALLAPARIPQPSMN